jgi:hypothetical protein
VTARRLVPVAGIGWPLAHHFLITVALTLGVVSLMIIGASR